MPAVRAGTRPAPWLGLIPGLFVVAVLLAMAAILLVAAITR